MSETQSMIGEAVLSAPQHTQAWDGQLALVVGYIVDELALDLEPVDPQAELDAAIKAYGDALDTPRADIAALRLRVSRAYAAMGA